MSLSQVSLSSLFQRDKLSVLLLVIALGSVGQNSTTKFTSLLLIEQADFQMSLYINWLFLVTRKYRF